MCRSVQVAFTRTPSVQFDLRLLGGNMTSLPFLEDWLQGTMRTLLEPYTLPDKAQRSPLLQWFVIIYFLGCRVRGSLYTGVGCQRATAQHQERVWGHMARMALPCHGTSAP